MNALRLGVEISKFKITFEKNIYGCTSAVMAKAYSTRDRASSSEFPVVNCFI